jgi:hypothetical protein
VTLPLLISAYLLGYGLAEGTAHRTGLSSVSVFLAAIWPVTIAAAILAALSLPIAIATGRLDRP